MAYEPAYNPLIYEEQLEHTLIQSADISQDLKGFGAPKLPNCSQVVWTRKDARFLKHRVSRRMHKIVHAEETR
jgi:hypothetical protein